MPLRVKKPCGYIGCYTLSTERYCTKHAPIAEARRREYFDRQRPSAAERGYDHMWRKLRKLFLAKNPICSCGQLALEVDHIIPLSKGGSKTDESNLQSLCKSCHSRKTATEDSGFARRSSGKA